MRPATASDTRRPRPPCLAHPSLRTRNLVPIIRAMDPRTVIDEAGAELATACGEALRSLAVYGSAAGDEFDPERSDVNLAVVLDPCDGSHLRRIAQWWVRWRGMRLAAPLVLSARELERSRDVFPLELLDMRARHRTLAGSEVFANLVVEREAVREE